MERYNLRFAATALACPFISDIESQSWAFEQTEGSRLGCYVAQDATMLTAEVGGRPMYNV